MPIHQLDTILPGFAALDLGATQIHAATAGTPVAVFGTTTAELRRLGAWLSTHSVRHVAMEATGVYWIPVHDQLQHAGFVPTLFHGAHARNLPGKKSDFSDCQWHAVLHSHGLLRPCFIAPEAVRALRAYARLREDHLEQAAMCVAHLQRALDCMNVRLHTVISQLHGVSGLRVIEAILAGERDPKTLTALCDAQILKRRRAEVEASLEGHWQEHHLFALRQALEAYRFHHAQIAGCDARIEEQLRALTAPLPVPAPVDKKKIKKVRHNAPKIEGLHGHLHRLCLGHDASVLPGLTPLSWMKLTAELGPDLSAWKTPKAFTSWLGLAPNRHQSGQRRRRVPRRHTRAGQIFREAAQSIARSKHLALGGCYRRLRGRRGEAVAMVAIARKLAELYYLALTRGLAYVEAGLQRYEEHCREQEKHRLRKFAARLGCDLVPRKPANQEQTA
jgi:transposase